MKTPFFSIIIPAYNVGTLIIECIESLFCQTFRDFEIIIVDDGSSDDTFDVCESLHIKYTSLQITLLHQTNLRQIAARMNGVDHANGDYCLFVDADDKLEKNALEAIYNSIQKYQADIVIFNGVRFWNGGETPFWKHYREYEYYMQNEDYLKFQQVSLTSDRFNNVWNKAFKRQVILNSKRYEDVSFLNVEEDFLMQLPWYDTAKNAVYIPMNLYRYRFNPNSVTNMKFNDQLFNMAVFLLAETFPYFEKWKVPNPEIICNRQFFSRVSGALKQFYLKGSGLSKSQKKKYLLNIANNNTFRQEYQKFDGCIKSKIGRLALWLLYHRLWRLALFLVEHDPKVHGKESGIVGIE